MWRAACAALLSLILPTSALAATDRIAANVAPGRSAVLRGNKRPEAIPQNDRGPVAATMRIDYATLYLKPAPGLANFLADQQNPSSPNYHRWLTPEQFADRFGLTGNDTGKITAWLQSQGLTVHDIARGRHWITFSGTAALMGQAFHTQLRHYQVNGADHFANSTDLSIPAAFDPVISAVGGLNDFGPLPLYKVIPADLQPQLNSGSTHYLAPDDISTIYNIAPLYDSGIDGTGQKLAVIGQTNINLADIRLFRARFNLPPNDPQIILYGPSPGIRQTDMVEADLDIEWSGAVARNATIVYVNSRSIYTSAQYAIDQNLAPVMTLSYGSCEASTADFFRSVAQQGSSQGITWMVSSGDSGAATCDYTSQNGQATKGLTVSYPTSLPEVTSVGGTEFDDRTGTWWAATNTANRASALGYIQEKVWSDAGGGASALFQKRAWQTGPGVPADGRRDVPDISFSASVHDAYEIVNYGVVLAVGGTSASSPVFAGVVTLLNQAQAAAHPDAATGLGNINPGLYRLAVASPDVFHDTTAGGNMYPCAQGSPGCVDGLVGYPATPGYDLASGLGSLDVARFLARWNKGSASSMSLSADPASYSADDTVQLSATVSGEAPIPTGSVTFLANDVELATIALAPGATLATATLPVQGTLLAAGKGSVSALYSGDATFVSSGASATLALKLPASGSLVIPSVKPNPVRQSGSVWPYTLQLSEKAGVATKITVFTVNNTDNLPRITNPNLSANGVFTTTLQGTNITPPLDRTFHFEGIDADGATWKRDLTVPFLGPLASRLTPSITLLAVPSIVQQNLNADPACQWSQQVTITENSGYAVNLASFSAGGVNLSGKISQLFGTTRLAPFGMLTATTCFSAVMPPAQRSYSIAGVTEAGGSISASATAILADPAASAAEFTVSSPAISIVDTATLDLTFTSATPKWTVAILPASQKWLTVSDMLGTGPATLKLIASPAGLSKGVYNAILSIQASDALPQSVQVPVVFKVGASSDISITGLGNAASGTQTFAPGELIAVYGTNLAPGTRSAGAQPLPLSLSCVSATVNGISAPLWFVSSGQINLQIPYETAAGPAALGVNNNGQIASFTFPVTPTAPGIFAFQGSTVPYPEGNPGQTLVCFITGDGDVTPTLVTGATPPAGTSLAQFPRSRQPVTMTVGGEQAKIVFSGIVTGLVGITQVNFTVPADLPPGLQPVIVTVGGVSSVPVNLKVNALSATLTSQ
jgi:uncharacterized protein (TIGR03437 family)